MSRRSLMQGRRMGYALRLLEVQGTAASAAVRSGANACESCDLGLSSYPFGAPPCRIYQPARSAMQAGRHRARAWVLEFEPSGSRRIEPLMGWTATDDPFAPIHLTFPPLAAAVDYAERCGLTHSVHEPAPDRSTPRPETLTEVLPLARHSGPRGTGIARATAR